MGKHKKFLKSEKAKVKLKGNKLKAAQNVTKTDFKVRKIVLTEQLKNVQKLETGERKVHNIQEVIARLKNSTSPEVISNLRDIIIHQPEDFQKHLDTIIKIVANLSLSIEKNVRKDGFKILDIICSQIDDFTLKPFFPILLTYLKCAMTHIKPAIQEDSLKMFDILLKNAPKLMANERDKVLPNYLDLVSKMRIDSGSTERTLSLQLGNKITNMKWRKSVLERLIVYLKCINSNQEGVQVEQSPASEIIIDDKREFLSNPFATRSTLDFGLSSLDHFETHVSSKQESAEQFSKYVHMIMPLVFETWMELKPVSDSNRNSVSQECAVMLKIIVDIQLELYSMIEESKNLKQQFLKKYQDNFDKLLMASFPYVQNTGNEHCIYQNLSIAIMFLQFAIKNQSRFTKYRENCFDFIVENIQSWKVKDAEFNFLMKKFIRELFTRESLKIFANDSKRVFSALVQKCSIDQSAHDPKLELVCQIFEKNEDFRQKDTDNLLTQMVLVLAEREVVPAYLVETVTSLCKKGNNVVIEAIDKNALSIVKNLLSKLRISGNLDPADDLKYKSQIANLVYWVKNNEVLLKIGESISDKSNSISVRIDQIISMKVN